MRAEIAILPIDRGSKASPTEMDPFALANDHPCPTLTRSVCVWGCLARSVRSGFAFSSADPRTPPRGSKNQEKSMRTRICLNRVIRCFRSRRFLLPLGVLAVAAVAIPLTVVLAAVIVDGGFVDNPAVFELDGNLTAGDAFGGVQGTRDWADSTGMASGLGADVATTTLPETGGVPPPNGFPYLLTDPAGVTIYTQGGAKDILGVSHWMYSDASGPAKTQIAPA